MKRVMTVPALAAGLILGLSDDARGQTPAAKPDARLATRPAAPRPASARPAVSPAAAPAKATRAPTKMKTKKDTHWKLKLSFGVRGYYSAHATYINNLAPLKGSRLPNAVGDVFRERLTNTGYFTHHLRFEPRISLGKMATLHVRLDGLQQVVWGDNDGLASSPLFAGNPTNTNAFGESIASIKLIWAYLDVDLKLGRLRVGRMPSNWGMGLLANQGGDLGKFRGGVDDFFGDNRSGSVVDRLLFATKPITVIKTLAKAKNPSSHWILAYAYDRLVEEPYWKNISLESQRPYGEQTFLSRQQNNVDEHVLVLVYSNPKFLAGSKKLKHWKHKSLTAGVYAVLRQQGAYEGIYRYFDGLSWQARDCASSDAPPACGATSKVGIIDPYFRLRLGPYLAEAEGYVIVGNTQKGRGIPIGDEVGKALIYGWVARLGYLARKFDVLLDVGQASGDNRLQDETFRQRSFHPDFNVGLIMYREFLRERSATALAQRLNSNVGGSLSPARGLQSNGGVINSVFIYPRARFRLLSWVTLKLGVVAAWVDRPDAEYLFQDRPCNNGKKGVACHIVNRNLGTEIDVGLDIRWAGRPGAEHLMFRLDMGYLIFGKQVADDYSEPGIFALRARLMFVF